LGDSEASRYRRQPLLDPGDVHGRPRPRHLGVSRGEGVEDRPVLGERARHGPGLRDPAHKVIFSTRWEPWAGLTRPSRAETWARKELTRRRDALNAARRRLPMVRVATVCTEYTSEFTDALLPRLR